MNPVVVQDAVGTAPCPVCGAINSQYARRGYYVKCSKCKVAFREEQESDAELDEYWQKEFWTEEEIEKRKNREPVFRDALKLLNAVKPVGGSVLDIGCGIGTFLTVCRECGWDVMGVEPSGVACNVARREYGIDLRNELFSSATFHGKKFDAVFAAQVLHHLPDPAAFLAEIDRVVADDGVIILRTPSLVPLELSLFVQHLTRRKKAFFCGPSIYTFHPDTLSLLFHRLGYRDVTFYNSRPYLDVAGAPGSIVRNVLVTAIKLATYGAVQAVYRLSGGHVVVGPSIFVVARKR